MTASNPSPNPSASRTATVDAGPVKLKFKAAYWVLLIAGVVLLIAATLKGYDLLRGVVTKNYFFHTLQVLLEFAAGIWLISSAATYHALRAGALLFAIFLGVSVYRGLQGQTDCGCFGPVPMNPWITASMDAVMLLWFITAALQLPRAIPAIRWRKILAPWLAVLMLIGGVIGGIYVQPARLHANGKITGGHGVVMMQPPAWDGKPFPLARYVRDSGTIMHGQWLAVIYFHSCPVCQHTIAGISRRLQKSPSHNVALLQLPPYGPLPHGIADARMLRLKLSDARLWHPPFLPVLVDLNHGMVTRVRSYIPGAWYGF
jgi:hypothetical protein